MGIDISPGMLREHAPPWPGVLHRYGDYDWGDGSPIATVPDPDYPDEPDAALPDWATREHRWGMSYSGFAGFRELLGKAAGFDVRAVWKLRKLNQETGEYEDVSQLTAPKPPIPELIVDEPAVNTVGDAALEPLIWHSDCEGFMTADECRQVAPRLRELAPKINRLDPDGWAERAEQLADLMQAVADDPTGLAVLRFH